jgi:outer membrane protein OmpA-like peptidoglycan-associated protein
MRSIVVGVLWIPVVAVAGPDEPRLEVGGAVGGHAFSADGELGVDDRVDEPGPEAGAALGVRAGYQLSRRLAVEGEAIAIPTKDDVLGDSAMVYGLRAHARVDVAALVRGKLRPFVVAGVGMHVLRSSSPQMDNDVDRAFHWGGGVRYALTPSLDVRLDLRHLIVPDRTLDGATSDVEVTAGVSYRFGAKRSPQRPIVRAVVTVAPPPPPPLPAHDDNGVIHELAGIGFENDSAKIDADSGSILDLAFLILKDNPQLYVEIAGHTSSEGNADYNLDLSLRRAQAVKAYLVRRGIHVERILTVGHGADVPIADNKTPEGRRKNRRIEFRILRDDEILR